MKKGESYLSQKSLLFTSGAVAVTDNVTILGGTVTLEEAYQAVLVTTSETRPTQPVVLENITVAQIDNMFIG